MNSILPKTHQGGIIIIAILWMGQLCHRTFKQFSAKMRWLGTLCHCDAHYSLSSPFMCK